MYSYWESEWDRRLATGSADMNVEKMAKLVYELTIRPEMADMAKLEIGCGPAVHARHLANIYEGWRTRWTGIDLSPTAINYAQAAGFDAVLGDIFTHEFDRKFECFLLLDSLEHIFDHEALAKRIKALATDRFCIFGNVPQYMGADARDVERQVTIKHISHLVNAVGLSGFEYEIYGIQGLPYMRFYAL